MAELKDLAEECYTDSQVWFPTTANDLFFMVACMAGEAGETINEVKKLQRGSVDYDEARERVLEEATDTLVYCMNIFGMLGADPQWWYDKVRAQNMVRFEPKVSKIKVKDNPQA